MRYAIVDENNIIINIIICESDEIAAQFGALPVREDLGIGDEYAAPELPEPEPTAEEILNAMLGVTE